MAKIKKSIKAFRAKQRRKAMANGWSGIPMGKTLPRGW
jgi:hypothetical protein